MDETDRLLINRLQGDFPLASAPFAAIGAELGLDEATLIERIRRLLAEGTLTRFGPLYQIERLGGCFLLAAIAVDEAQFERIAALVNAYPEVAHNYEREHALNMWFVIAAENDARVREVVTDIEQATGYRVYRFPKEREYFVRLLLAA